MPKRRSTKTVEALRHDEASRRNIPTAEFRSLLDRSEQSPVQVAYQRRNRDLDPQRRGDEGVPGVTWRAW